MSNIYTYTHSVWKVSVLSNAVPAYFVPGAAIPGMPPAPPQGRSPEGINPGPTWQNQFGHLTKSKYPVRFDYRLQFSGLYSSAGDIAFNAITVGNLAYETNPDAARPGPAWRGQFGVKASHQQPSILFDYRVQLSGSYVSAGDIAFGAITAGFRPQTGGTDPDAALPGPAWFNTFRAYLGKHAIEYDYSPAFSGSYLTAGDIAFGATAVGNLAYETNPENAVPGPAWHNAFDGQWLKRSVLFDYRLQFSGSYSTAGDIAFGATTVGSVGGIGPMDPQGILASPAWLNRFKGAKRKYKVLFDSQPSVYGPFCFAGSSEVLLFTGLGGSAILASLDATDGGSAVDTNAYGGTAVDIHAGLGGAETNDTYGGTATDGNHYGGVLVGGCYE